MYIYKSSNNSNNKSKNNNNHNLSHLFVEPANEPDQLVRNTGRATGLDREWRLRAQ